MMTAKLNNDTIQTLNRKHASASRQALLLALGFTAALAVGCSGDASVIPTAASDLPVDATQSSTQSSSNSGSETGGILSAVEASCAELRQKQNCGAFDQVRLSAEQIAPGKARIRYHAMGFKFQAFYVVRFWPEGRHNGVPQDFPIGLRQPGDRAISGEFVADVPLVSRETVLQYNVDLDLWGDEGYFRAGDLSCQDQCDRGGELILTPPVLIPPTEIACECQRSYDPAEDVREERTVCEGDVGFGQAPGNFITTPGACVDPADR